MKQLKFFINLSKEENYLNQMASQGWLLKKRSLIGTYHFTKHTPKQLDYKIDYRTFKKKEDFNSYISLFEDADFQHVYGTSYSGHQYFLPKTKEASMDIFSDKESKAQRYIRFQQNCIALFMVVIIYLMVSFISVDFVLADLFFLTPGLWEMQGDEFWRAFWFEFPFMLMRVLPVMFFALAGILNSIWAVKAKKLYRDMIV